MRIIIASFFIILVSLSGARAQTDFREGYLVSLENENYWMTEQKDVQEFEGRQVFKEDNKWRGIINYLIFDCISEAGNIARNIQFNGQILQ